MGPGVISIAVSRAWRDAACKIALIGRAIARGLDVVSMERAEAAG